MGDKSPTVIMKVRHLKGTARALIEIVLGAGFSLLAYLARKDSSLKSELKKGLHEK